MGYTAMLDGNLLKLGLWDAKGEKKRQQFMKLVGMENVPEEWTQCPYYESYTNRIGTVVSPHGPRLCPFQHNLTTGVSASI